MARDLLENKAFEELFYQNMMVWVKILFVWLIPFAIMAWSIEFLFRRKRR